MHAPEETLAASARAPRTADGAAAVLELLRSRGPLTRAEIVEATGLSRSTVAARLAELLTLGLVRQAGAAASSGGRPPVRFAWDPRSRSVLAIDLGASHARVARTDLDGAVDAIVSVELDVADDPGTVLDRLVATAAALPATPGAGPLAGVGIGLPGPVSARTGRPVAPPIMPGWDDYDVAGRLAAGLGVPVHVDNDVNVMALGEHRAAWPDSDDLLFVKVATGIGAGVIAGGRLQRGAAGSAGDLGHVRVPRPSDVRCECGRIGCLEALASGRAVAADLDGAGPGAAGPVDAEAGASDAGGDGRPRVADVVARVRAGDEAAVARVQQAGRDLGSVLAGAVNLLNPGVIVLGGRLAACGAPLVDAVRGEILSRSTAAATRDLRIELSRTAGEAAVRGASRLVAEHVLSAAGIEQALAR
jgi:predicted NBD/HSP70 family sugar kinase